MKMKTLCLQVFAAILLASCMSPWPPRPADLLFHVAEADNAITAVTPGMIDHVAIMISADSVIEAVGKGVVTTPLDSIRAQKGHYLVARVRRADQRKSLENARRYLGRNYDWLYLPDNDAIYCSELVLLSFVNKRGKPIFQPVPMTFRDSTGQIPAYWQEFYKRNGMDVPEGRPGSNPSELSQRKGVRIIRRIIK